MEKTYDPPILVSIFCMTYNHEKYIRKALEGFISQKAEFRFEVLVHDDASTDHTAEIIREYEAKYPDIIKPVYQTENQYSRHIPIIANHLLPKARGKYFAWCEGDDFWSDPQKLQLQVDALEKHKDCAVCFTRVAFVASDTEQIRRLAPERDWPERVLEKDVFINSVLQYRFAWQISGMMVRRNVYIEYLNDLPPYYKYFGKYLVGDIPMFLYFGLQGNAYYINRCMSCYRAGTSSGWSRRTKGSKESAIAWYRSQAQGYKAFDRYSDYQYHESVLRGIQRCNFSIAKRNYDIKAMKGPELSSLYKELSIKEKLKLNFLHCFPWSSRAISLLRSIGRRRR